MVPAETERVDDELVVMPVNQMNETTKTKPGNGAV